MRISVRTAVAWFVIILICLLSSCDGNGCQQTDEPADNIVILEDDPGSIDPNCCGVTHSVEISGSTPAGGRYYWLALLDQDTLISYGNPIYLPEGPFANETVEVNVSYLDQIASGEYHKVVFASESLSQVGNIRQRIIAQDCGTQGVVSYVDSVCAACCTGPGDRILDSNGVWTRAPNRYKAGAVMWTGNLLYAGANIETKYGRLCAEGVPGGSLDSAHQNAFVGIFQHLDLVYVQPLQMQCGWIRCRYDGVYDTAIYAEANVDKYTVLEWFYDATAGIELPLDSTFHYYQVYRPNDTDLQFWYDYRLLRSATIRAWKWLNLEYVSWQGEIRGRETDMPGTSQHPCRFNNCEYQVVGGQVTYASFRNDPSYGDQLFVTQQSGNRPAEWGIGFVQGTRNFWIWDVHPLQ